MCVLIYVYSYGSASQRCILIYGVSQPKLPDHSSNTTGRRADLLKRREGFKDELRGARRRLRQSDDSDRSRHTQEIKRLEKEIAALQYGKEYVHQGNRYSAA